MKPIFLLIALLSLVIVVNSCISSNIIKYSPLFELPTSKNDGEERFTYYLEVPKGGRFQKPPFKLMTEHAEELRVLYQDSSLIYLVNEPIFGAKLNLINCWGIGGVPHDRKANDTITYQGIQKDGRYWRQDFIGSIAIGYINVPEEKKEAYNTALSTLRRKKISISSESPSH
jgi:hypothetical protein